MDMDRLERDIQDYKEDNRANDFTDRTRLELAGMRQKADGLADSYIGEQAKLYREDGQRKFSDAEHQELLDDLTRQRDERFSELKERAGKVSSEIGEKLEVVEVASKPERYLSDAEMEQATIRANFVREDVESRPLGELPGLLREAELSGGRVELWLAARYAQMRHDRERERLHEASPGVNDVRAEEVSRHLREVREAVARVREQFNPPGARQRKETLEKLRGEAAGLAGHIRDKSLTHEERIAASESPFH